MLLARTPSSWWQQDLFPTVIFLFYTAVIACPLVSSVEASHWTIWICTSSVQPRGQTHTHIKNDYSWKIFRKQPQCLICFEQCGFSSVLWTLSPNTLGKWLITEKDIAHKPKSERWEEVLLLLRRNLRIFQCDRTQGMRQFMEREQENQTVMIK